jgi:SAM-dependent methyltransferase
VSEPYWRGAAEDEAMQEEHGFIWRAMLDTIDIDLAGFRVLDAGCNRGGFLRLLVDESGIAEGCGYDAASGAIDDARRLAGQRPLTFETAVTVPAGWAEFDAAFSHEVLYLLHDLASHAAATFAALEPGAPYFAVMGVHAGSGLMSAWHGSVAGELGLPRRPPFLEPLGDGDVGVERWVHERAPQKIGLGQRQPPAGLGLCREGVGRGAAVRQPRLIAA